MWKYSEEGAGVGLVVTPRLVVSGVHRRLCGTHVCRPSVCKLHSLYTTFTWCFVPKTSKYVSDGGLACSTGLGAGPQPLPSPEGCG